MAKLEQMETDGTVQQSAPTPSGALFPQQQDRSQIQSFCSGDVLSFQVVNEGITVGNPWTMGLLNCHKHPTSVILPGMNFGQIAEVLDAGEMNCELAGYIYLVMMSALCSHWLMGSKYRAKLRRNYNWVEAPHSDIVAHIFCLFCALSQEELRNKGLDSALGWKGIIAQQQGQHNNGHQGTMVPPQNQGMIR